MRLLRCDADDLAGLPGVSLGGPAWTEPETAASGVLQMKWTSKTDEEIDDAQRVLLEECQEGRQKSGAGLAHMVVRAADGHPTALIVSFKMGETEVGLLFLQKGTDPDTARCVVVTQEVVEP